MRFSLITTVLAFAFVASGSATALDKRDTATCVSSLVAVSVQYTVVFNAVSAYTADKGYPGFLLVQAQESNLETKITSAYASSACCISFVVSVTDANSIIAKIDPLSAQIEGVMAAIIAKKPVFDSVPLVTGLVKGDLNSLRIKSSTLNDCLLAVTPSSLTTTVRGYIDRIDAAFVAAIAAYS